MSRSKHHGTTAFPAVRAMAAKSEVPAAGVEDRLPMDGQDVDGADHVAEPVAAADEGMVSAAVGSEKIHAEASADHLLSKPLAAAEAAANAVLKVLGQPGDPETLLPQDDLAKYVCGLKEAAAFWHSEMEDNELWNHLALKGYHPHGINSFEQLPQSLQVGWCVFTVTIFAQKVVAEVAAKAAPKPSAKDIYRVPIDETTLEPVGGMFDRFDDKP